MHNNTPATHWFEDWFDHNYLKLYHHRNIEDADQQVRLIIKTLKPKKDELILDLACGEGRHCLLFHEKGFNIKGIDLSTHLVKSGKTKYPFLDIKVGDMRHIKGKHDIILSLFTSFGYFDNDKDNFSVIRSINRALKPDGWFWIDYLNPVYVIRNLVPDNEIKLEDGTTVIESRFIENNTIIKEIIFNGPGKNNKYQERVKLYTREDLETMLIKSGIYPQGVFGNYKGSEWSSCSPRTIIYGRKKSE